MKETERWEIPSDDIAKCVNLCDVDPETLLSCYVRRYIFTSCSAFRSNLLNDLFFRKKAILYNLLHINFCCLSNKL